MKRAPLPLLLLYSACTSLGPMPATTGISASPVGRPGVEVQVGSMPGFFASQSAQNEADGRSMNAGSVVVDFDRWLPLKGVIAGGRLFGVEDDTPFEPFVGYRRSAGIVSVGGVAFGSTNRSGSLTGSPGASAHAVRFGGEAMVDVIVWKNDFFRFTAQAAVSATRSLASGSYCVNSEGEGIDCNQDDTLNTHITGKFVGVYPAATGSLGFDFGRHEGVFDSARIALLGSGGQMPLVLNGMENGKGSFFQLGISLAVRFGLGRADSGAAQSE